MHHLLSQGQRELVTARLFRRESIKTIAEDMKVSERSIQRISTNLRKYGTTVAPRDPKLMGRPPLLTKEMHEGLTRFLIDNPISLFPDMAEFLRKTYDKEVTKALLTHTMKKLGFTRIIIMRGPRAKRQDLPSEALRVHHAAAEAIAEQMRINDEIKSHQARDPNPAPGCSLKGKYAWVRLHPGEDTGFRPRVTQPKKPKSSNNANADKDSTAPDHSLLRVHQPEETYVSPYA